MGNLLVMVQPTPQQLVDYTNALLTINNYAYGITNQQMPILQYPPSDYGTFTTSFASAKQDALNWSQNIFVSVVQLPSTIKDQAAILFNMEETYIEMYLQMLITDPNDAKAKNGLATALAATLQIIKNQTDAIGEIETELNAFATKILKDATILTNISTDALNDAAADKDTITQLNKDIENLKSNIAAAQNMLTVSEIGIGVSIFVGLIGVVCCIVPGGQGIGAALIVGGVFGLGASIAGVVIEKQRIKAMQASIDSDQNQISGLGKDILQLTALSTQFSDLYNANLQATTALSTIKSMWQNLAATVSDVSTELTDVNSDVTSGRYTQALADFKEAETNWNAVVAFADALAGINYSWEDTSGNWHNYGETNPSADSGNVHQIAAAA